MDHQPEIPSNKEEDVDMISLPQEESDQPSAQPSDRPASQQECPSEGESKSRVTDAHDGEGSSEEGADSQLGSTTDSGIPIRTDATPSVAEQVRTIENLLKQFSETPLEDGDTALLVSRRWLAKAQSFGVSAKCTTKEPADAEAGPGPVDNSDIIQSIFTDSNGQEFVRLKPGAGLEDFELFPQQAWDLLISWYGLADQQKPIFRTAHNTALDATSPRNIQFEFHPPVLTIHRLWSANSPLPIERKLKEDNPPPLVVVHSTSCRYHDFLKKAKEQAGVELSRKIRLWRVLQTLPTAGAPDKPKPKPPGISTPPDSPEAQPLGDDDSPWAHLLLEVDQFLKLDRGVERDLVEAQDTTHHPKYNGNRSLATVSLTVDQTLVLDENIDQNTFVSNYLPNGAAKDKAVATRGSSSSLAAANTSGRSSPAPRGPITRGRAQQKPGRTIGCVGLQNLGNTCYMNSAVQCVRSVEELTKYFLTREAEKEINPDNPLSHNGDVARAYGRLLDDIYRDPPLSSVAPRQFKNIIGRYAPSFSGYGQQDSQEFLGFLLDGLQEDLNRIKKKPYIEKPDSTDEMINNPEAIREMADKVWDITKKRDDSVIADLFTGMYKSTLVCPVCSKVSITFDPFTNLTLPLPIANVWNRPIKYYPLNEPPVQIMVDIDKNSSIKALKEFVSTRVGVPVERLAAAEEFKNKFFKLYEDLSSISEEIQPSDIPTVHEVESSPTNPPSVQQKQKKSKFKSMLNFESDPDDSAPVDDPMAERLLVPVVHRILSDDGGFRRRGIGRNQGTPAPPHFIVVTPSEARSEDAIRRKILEKVATFTTSSELVAVDDSDATDTTDTTDADADIVNTASDLDSGDSNVVAKSVEGEEGLVDVTMKDVDSNNNSEKVPGAAAGFKPLRKFNNQRPKWIDPQQFLHPNLQNLFDLGYYTDGSLSIPNGWQAIQDDNNLPRLSSRQPRPEPSPDMHMQSPGAWPNSEDSATDSPEPNPTTRMVDESSDEDSDFPKTRNVHSRPNGNRFNQMGPRGKKKMKDHKTYGKKGKRRLAKQMKNQRRATPEMPDFEPVSDDAEPDYGPLIRLGEGIVADWGERAWDLLFGADSTDDTRGSPTYLDIPKLDDPALEAKKKQRQLRRKNGITLSDCLAEFEREEILSEQDTWYCPRCKEHRRASKKFDLWKTPDILAVHLKRFSSAGFRREKLDILVDFPVEGLDLSERVIHKEDGKVEIYDLIAVDDHWGGLGGGHYTAFAKNFIDGEWYEYNDTSVSRQSDPSRVITNAAYLLFYRRRSEVPLGGPRFQEIVDRYENELSDQDMSDSGEGRRLDQGSSPIGSSSALAGAGRTLHEGGGRGSAKAYTNNIGSSSRSSPEADGPPPYTRVYSNNLTRLPEADDDDDNERDVSSSGSVSRAAALRWGGDHANDGGLEDEGIDMDEFRGSTNNQGAIDNMASVMSSNWNFTGIDGQSRSDNGGVLGGDEDDLASDKAQNDSSDDDISFGPPGLLDDANSLMQDDQSTNPDFVLSDQASSGFARYDVPPAAGRLGDGTWRGKVYEIPASMESDEASERVDEIHLGDDEADKETKKA